jgi:hypothetical protein
MKSGWEMTPYILGTKQCIGRNGITKLFGAGYINNVNYILFRVSLPRITFWVSVDTTYISGEHMYVRLKFSDHKLIEVTCLATVEVRLITSIKREQ